MGTIWLIVPCNTRINTYARKKAAVLRLITTEQSDITAAKDNWKVEFASKYIDALSIIYIVPLPLVIFILFRAKFIL